MVGFVAAVIAELTTNQSVWSQLAGKTASNGKLLEHSWQFAPLGFGAVVALLTYASIAPQFQAGELPKRLTASMNYHGLTQADSFCFDKRCHALGTGASPSAKDPCSVQGRAPFTQLQSAGASLSGAPQASAVITGQSNLTGEHIVAGEKPDSRSVGPFTPFAEKWNGRIAMLGFSGEHTRRSESCIYINAASPMASEETGFAELCC